MSIKEKDLKLRPKRKIKESLWQKKKNEKERMQPGNLTAVKGQRKHFGWQSTYQPYYQTVYTCDSNRCVFVFALGYKIHFPSPASGDFEGVHPRDSCLF